MKRTTFLIVYLSGYAGVFLGVYFAYGLPQAIAAVCACRLLTHPTEVE